jgi:hypothetical protein
MAFSTTNGLNEYLAASKQRIPMVKTASRTSVALIPFSVFDLAGIPAAGTLAGTSTANGVVPTDATAGTPIINAFGGGNVGYLTKVEYFNSVISTIFLYDLLFKAGAYAYNSGTTSLTSQPAISSRCPDYPGSGTVFGNGTEIWIEVVTAMTSATAWQVQVTYTNSAGTGSRTSIVSAAQAAAALTVGKMFPIALQAGDSGVQKIDSVIVTTGGAAAGTFNVLIMRRLWGNRVTVANSGGIDDILKTGAPIVYADSAIIQVIQADSTSTGLPNLVIEIANVA